MGRIKIIYMWVHRIFKFERARNHGKETTLHVNCLCLCGDLAFGYCVTDLFKCDLVLYRKRVVCFVMFRNTRKGLLKWDSPTCLSTLIDKQRFSLTIICKFVYTRRLYVITQCYFEKHNAGVKFFSLKTFLTCCVILTLLCSKETNSAPRKIFYLF